MIEYINTKNIQGPYHEKKEIYMPNQAEVTSDKFTNMWVFYFAKQIKIQVA